MIKGGLPRFQVIGMWSPYVGIELFHHRNMFERRKNLTGVTIVNTVLPWIPLSVVEDNGDSDIYQSGNIIC